MSNWFKWVSLGLGISGSLLCFVPFALPPDTIQSEFMKEDLIIFLNSIFFNFSVCIILLLDLLLETFFNITPCLYAVEQMRNLSVGLILSDLLLMNLSENSSIITLTFCFLSFRILLFCTTFLNILSKADIQIWSNRSSIVMIIFLVIGFISNESKSSITDISNIILTVISAISLSISLLIFSFKMFFSFFVNNSSNIKNINSYNLYRCVITIYVTAIAVIYICSETMSRHANWQILMASYLFMETCGIIVVILAYLHVGKVEWESSKTAMRAKGQFVRHISHEVRSSLTTVFNGLELFEKELLKLPEDMQETLLDLLVDIKKSCDISLTTVNEMLTYDKIEEGILKLEKAWIFALQYVKATVSPFVIQARQSDISLEVVVSPENDRILQKLQIFADPHKLGQVIRNMVSNALKFSPGGSKVIVRISFTEMMTLPNIDRDDDNNLSDGEHGQYKLCIDVIDSGPGISKENQAKLFKEVIQFNPGKLQNGGGSGLGLWISHGIVKLHAGSLSVLSEGEGYGCTFSLKISASLCTDEQTAPVEEITPGVLTEVSRTNVRQEREVGDGDDEGRDEEKSREDDDEEDDEDGNEDEDGDDSTREAIVHSLRNAGPRGSLGQAPSRSMHEASEGEEDQDRKSVSFVVLEKPGMSSPSRLSLRSLRNSGDKATSNPNSSRERPVDLDEYVEGSTLRGQRGSYTADTPLAPPDDCLDDQLSSSNNNINGRGSSRFPLRSLAPPTMVVSARVCAAEEDGHLEHKLSANGSPPIDILSVSQHCASVVAKPNDASPGEWRTATHGGRLKRHSTFSSFSIVESDLVNCGRSGLNSAISLSKSTNFDNAEDKGSQESRVERRVFTRHSVCGDGCTSPGAPHRHVEASPKRMSDSSLSSVRRTSRGGIFAQDDELGESRVQMRLLVVDDASLNRKLLCRLFRERGDLCVEAEDGVKALQRYRDAVDRLEALNEPIFDAILMDYQMPNMDGPTCAKELRKQGYRGRIIGVTGNGMDNDVQIMLEHGCDAVLLKPLKLKMFDQTLRSLSPP